MIRGLKSRTGVLHRSLQDRLSVFITLAVIASVAITGLAAYLITTWSFFEQLDESLVQVADATGEFLAGDIENVKSLDSQLMEVADVTLMVVRADSTVFTVHDSKVSLIMASAHEVSVARRQQGYSARTAATPANAEPGAEYRIVAVPITDNDHRYALVVARELTSTRKILISLALSLWGFGLGGAVMAGAMGWSIARSGIQPLSRLTDAVAQVTETNDLTHIEIEGTDELAELTRSFNTMLRSLNSSQERQRRLIADAGHELRTPLTAMRTNVELLVADDRSGMLPPGARSEILRDIAEQLGEFTTLIGDLVQLSREDRVHEAAEAIDLRVIINSAVARAKRRGPGLTFDVEMSPLYLMGEPDTLERAITNLLDNAVKFSPEGGTITIRLIGDRLTVEDEGPGIADEDLPHVFERFYRSERARAKPGSGLGLSIVAQAVKAHGGWVKAGRATSGGALFTVRLPGSPIPPEEQNVDQTAPAGKNDSPLPKYDESVLH